MPSTRSFEPRRTGRFSSTVNFATNVLITTTLAVFICCLLTTPTHAQTPLSLGKITLGSSNYCSNGAGWYYYNNNFAIVGMTCQNATVSQCTNNGITNAPAAVTIGYLNPVGVLPGLTQPNGLIVLHNGDGGIMPASYALTDAYFRAGYEVVQIAWIDDWEMTSDPIPVGTNGNIQDAACNPATVFHWVYTNLFQNVVQQQNGHAAMCGLGDSAGSAAIAYTLAYYGGYNWFDHVELLSGPVLSDVSQGCQVPAASSVNVCGLQNCGSGANTYQCGCQLGATGSSWTLEPTYIQSAQTAVGKWTNDNTCNNTFPISTSGPSQAAWLAQSIVDQAPGGSNGAAPYYNYPSTSMSGWLCRTVHNPSPSYNCAANGNNNSNLCPNNSSPQGQIYYANFGPTNLPDGGALTYAVYAVDNCANAEGVGGGTVPGFYPSYFNNGQALGLTAITDDMVGYTSGTTVIPQKCAARH